MIYVVNREAAKEQSAAHAKSNKKFTALNIGGIGLAVLSTLALLATTFMDLPNWYFWGCIGCVVAGGILAKCTEKCAFQECLATRFFELENKYTVLEWRQMAACDGFRRVTVLTEDSEGNVTERYFGMAKAQANTRYKDITLDINKETVYFPYPPKEEK